MDFELKITGQTVKRMLIGLLAAVAVAGVVLFILDLIGSSDPFAGVVNEDRVQAVFLDDGRVFFGELEEGSVDYYILRDAYFVQQTPGEEEDDEPRQEVRARTGEVHGPDNRMLVAKDDVVLIENLSSDSQLAETIEQVRSED